MSGNEAGSMGSKAAGAHLVAGKYKLERTLGEGGMGVVYAAEHVDLQKRVAIKIMREELISQSELVERMVAEARTVARLRSEHVAQVIDVGRLKGGAPFIVMEYLDGCDLNTHLLEVGRPQVELTVAYVMQACEAVAEAHAAGIVHRDIKPENLFLSARTDGEPIIKVLDFGISRSMKSGERDLADSLIAGSPDYMSPESMQPDGRVDAAADIWSLGAVLYELLTNRRPFEAATVAETCARVLASDPVPPSTLFSDIPPALESAVLRCLRKNPRERFASVAELAAALAPFGPDGALEQAARVARVASGGRWNPRSTATPKRLSFASFNDLPNSTVAVVADPRKSFSTIEGAAPRSRWKTGIVFAAGAIAASVIAFVGAQRAASPAVSRVAAVAAPPTVATSPTSVDATQLPGLAKTASAVASAPASPRPLALKGAGRQLRAQPVASQPSAAVYDDEAATSASAAPAPSADPAASASAPVTPATSAAPAPPQEPPALASSVAVTTASALGGRD